MTDCNKLLLKQFEIIELIVKQIKHINRISGDMGFDILDTSKIEADLVESIEILERLDKKDIRWF